MKTLKHLSFLLLIILFVSNCESCDKESICPGTYEMGTFELLQSSKDLFPYDSTHIKVVFSDSAGNEYETFMLRQFSIFGPTSKNVACEQDEAESIAVEASSELISATLEIPSIPIDLNVGFRASPDLNNFTQSLVADVASVSGPFSTGGPFSGFSILLDQRSSPEPFSYVKEPTSSVTLHDKTFENVFSNEDDEGHAYTIYFNFEYGIVGFTINATDETYQFERFE